MRTNVGVAVAALLLTGCGPSEAEENARRLNDAYLWCIDYDNRRADEKTLADSPYDTALMLSLSREDDRTLLVDTEDENDFGGFLDLECVLDQLDTPAGLRASMDSTTANMGRRHRTSDGLRYEWSYHPDSGVSLVVEALG